MSTLFLWTVSAYGDREVWGQAGDGVSYLSEKYHHTRGRSQCYTSEPPSWL